MNSHDKLFGRTPLPQDAQITINGISFTITNSVEEVCAGSTCLVYRGYTKDLPGRSMMEKQFHYRAVIIKEFYPFLKNNAIMRDPITHELIIPAEVRDSSDCQNALRQFKQGIELQKKLSASTARSVIVPVCMEGTFGDSYYNISDSRRGHSLDFERHETLSAKLLHFITLLDAFEVLHNAGFLMFDIKPENFLWSYDDTSVLFVDTDSFIEYSKETITPNRLLFTNMKYAAPEIRQMELFLENGDVEMANRLLSPATNFYSLGLYLYELIYGRSYTGKRDQDLDEIGQKLQQIFDKALIEDPFLRARKGYQRIEEMIAHVNHIYGLTLPPADPNLDIDESIDEIIADLWALPEEFWDNW